MVLQYSVWISDERASALMACFYLRQDAVSYAGHLRTIMRHAYATIVVRTEDGEIVTTLHCPIED